MTLSALTWVTTRADGALLVATEDGTALRVDLQRPVVTARTELGSQVARAAALPDGRWLVGLRDGRVCVLDGDTLATQREWATGHGRVRGLGVHRSGQRLATSGDDGAVRTWSTATWQRELELVDGKVPAAAVAFANDLVVAGYADGFVVAWTPDGAQKVTSRQVLASAIDGIAVHPSGQRVVLGGSGGGIAALNVGPPGEWTTLEGWRTPPKPIAVNALAFAPDGRFAAACSDDAARLFRSMDVRVEDTLGSPFWLRSPKPEWRREFIVAGACFVPGTDWLATAHFDGKLRWWRGTRCEGEFAPTG